MTYKQWITTTLGRFNMTAQDIEMILVNQQQAIPNPDGEVNVRIAKTALVREFASIIPLANITEGGYSQKWKWEAIKAWYNLTCRELGIAPIDLDAKPRPKIRDRSNIW